MSLGDVDLTRTLEVIVKGFHFVPTINRYHYLLGDPIPASDLDDFVGAFVSTVLQPTASILNNAMQFQQVQVRSLDNSVFTQVPIAVSGAASGESLPPNVTIRVRFARSVGGVRGGYKRYSGVPENNQSGGVLVGYPAGQLQAVADAHIAAVNFLSNQAAPVVIVATFNGQPLPNLKYWVPSGATIPSFIGTQNTRKRG